MERDQATKLMHDLLRALVAKKGSDLFLSATYPPAMKVDGRMTPFAAHSGPDLQGRGA